MSPLRTRTREPDEACAQAVDLARRAAEELAGEGRVGAHAGAEADGDRVVTHLFGCVDPAYHGWRWAVTVTRASRAKNVTVSEVILLPGPDAILAPAWVPWRERLRPGDLGVGDILPTSADDERLVPLAALEGEDGFVDWGVGAWSAGGLVVGGAPVTAEPGAPGTAGTNATQARVLSAMGRDDAAIRWYAGEHGPESPIAHAAPAPCGNCGFLVHLSGPLGQVFGVCANAYAPDDGRVVSVDHGCGAHSESMLQAPAQPLAPVIDEVGYDFVDVPGVTVEETLFESLDHG